MLVVVAAVMFLPAFGCTPAVDIAHAHAAAGAENLDASIAQLRTALAAHPHDAGVHLGLGLALLRKGVLGAALRHLEVAADHGLVLGPDRAIVADLYLRRARIRAKLGDGSAYGDLERARALGADVDAGLTATLYLAGAVAELRAGSDHAWADARALLARAGPEATRITAALTDPETAPIDAVASAGRWAWKNGAKRTAHVLLSRAIFRGDRDPTTVLDYVLADTWWRGPEVALVVPRPEPDEPAPFSTTTDLGQARRVIEDALAAWVVTEEPWLARVSRHVDIDALWAAREVPIYLAATLQRAQGHLDAARRFLAQAIEAAPSLDPDERAIVIAEAAAQGIEVAMLAHLVGLGPTTKAAVFAAARAARGRGDSAGEARILASAPAPARHPYFRSSLDLGALVATAPDGSAALDEQLARRWLAAAAPVKQGIKVVRRRWRTLARVSAPHPWRALFQVRLGWPSPARIAAHFGRPDEAAALAGITAAYARDPARADSLARRFVDERLAIGERGPMVAALFSALGDPARARAWWEEILASSPSHPAYLEGAALAMARARDADAALTLLTRAAARSGDAGATWLEGARGLIDGGQPLAALSAARRAMQLAPAGARKPALETVAKAALAMGRTADAERALTALIDEAGPERAASAESYVLRAYPEVFATMEKPARWTRRDRALWRWQRGDRNVAGEVMAAATADPTDPELAIARAEILAPTDADEAAGALAMAAAFNPRSVAVRAQRLAMAAPGDAAFATTVAELLLIGTADPDAGRAAAAMTAVAGAFARMGQHRRAALATADAKALRRAVAAAYGQSAVSAASVRSSQSLSMASVHTSMSSGLTVPSPSSQSVPPQASGGKPSPSTSTGVPTHSPVDEHVSRVVHASASLQERPVMGSASHSPVTASQTPELH